MTDNERIAGHNGTVIGFDLANGDDKECWVSARWEHEALVVDRSFCVHTQRDEDD